MYLPLGVPKMPDGDWNGRAPGGGGGGGDRCRNYNCANCFPCQPGERKREGTTCYRCEARASGRRALLCVECCDGVTSWIPTGCTGTESEGGGGGGGGGDGGGGGLPFVPGQDISKLVTIGIILIIIILLLR